MIDELLNLRNTVHEGKFRFKLTPNLWESLYVPEEELKESKNFIKVIENGRLRGYAIYTLLTEDNVKVCGVLEICADRRDVLIKLIDYVIKNCAKEKVDFIFLKRCEELFEDVFDERGFFTSMESVVMMVLHDPKQLLSCLSEEVKVGKILGLTVKGFDPIGIKVGEKGIMVIDDEDYDVTVQTDRRTFLKLFFGKTSFYREFVRGKININNILYLSVVSGFFKIVKHAKWYIPSGDWV